METYKHFTFTYDPQPLLDLFNNSTKTVYPNRTVANLAAGSNTSTVFSNFFKTFSFITQHDNSIELNQLTGTNTPHVNPGNNGLLIFPLSGNIVYNNFSYSPPVDSTGRPQLAPNSVLDPALDASIKSTLVQTINISGPTAVDGLSTFTLGPDTSGADPIALYMKIPMDLTWGVASTLLF